MKKIILFNIMMLLCCTGCRNKIEDVVKEQYHLQQDSAQQVVDLAKELNFEWDTLYVFGPGIGQETMKEVVKAPIPSSFDLTYVVLFKKDGRIFHYEATPIEDWKDYGVWFNYEEKYLVVPKDSARFIIKKSKLGLDEYLLYRDSIKQ